MDVLKGTGGVPAWLPRSCSRLPRRQGRD